MKTPIILLLTLGLAIADPISKQIVSADNNHAHSTKCNESVSKHNEETTSNKGDSEQKKQVIHPTIIGDTGGDVEMQIPNVEVIVEEAIDLPGDFSSEIVSELFPYDSDEAAEAEVDEFSNEIEEKNPDEIMETAAGFVPLPIIRRRKKPQNRFATRRHFKRQPYYYYPSYYRRSPYYYSPYYAFYRPSSLRYY